MRILNFKLPESLYFDISKRRIIIENINVSNVHKLQITFYLHEQMLLDIYKAAKVNNHVNIILYTFYCFVF